MSVKKVNIERELRRIVAEGRISLDSLHAITGIPGDAIASFFDEAHEREPGLTASPLPIASEDIGRLSALVGQLTEGLKIDDDVRLTAIIQTLTAQFRMRHQHIALLTGVDLDDLESFVSDSETLPLEKKYRLGIRAFYLLIAISNAAPDPARSRVG